MIRFGFLMVNIQTKCSTIKLFALKSNIIRNQIGVRAIDLSAVALTCIAVRLIWDETIYYNCAAPSNIHIDRHFFTHLDHHRDVCCTHCTPCALALALALSLQVSWIEDILRIHFMRLRIKKMVIESRCTSIYNILAVFFFHLFLTNRLFYWVN